MGSSGAILTWTRLGQLPRRTAELPSRFPLMPRQLRWSCSPETATFGHVRQLCMGAGGCGARGGMQRGASWKGCSSDLA